MLFPTQVETNTFPYNCTSFRNGTSSNFCFDNQVLVDSKKSDMEKNHFLFSAISFSSDAVQQAGFSFGLNWQT